MRPASVLVLVLLATVLAVAGGAIGAGAAASSPVRDRLPRRHRDRQADARDRVGARDSDRARQLELRTHADATSSASDGSTGERESSSSSSTGHDRRNESSSSSTGEHHHHSSSSSTGSGNTTLLCDLCRAGCVRDVLVQCSSGGGSAQSCECSAPVCEPYCPACTSGAQCQCDKGLRDSPMFGYFPSAAARAHGEPCYCANCTCPVTNVRCATRPNYSGRYNAHCNCVNQHCNVGYGCTCTNSTGPDGVPMNGILNAACDCTNCTATLPCDGACDPSCCVHALNVCDTDLPGCALPPPPPAHDDSSDKRWYIIGGCFGGAFVLLGVFVIARTCCCRKPRTGGSASMRELSRAASRRSSRASRRAPSVSARKGGGGNGDASARGDRLLSSTGSNRRGDESAFSSVVTSPRHDPAGTLSPGVLSPAMGADSALFSLGSLASGAAPHTQLHDMSQPLVPPSDEHSLN